MACLTDLSLAQSPTHEELLEHLLECDVTVYNISENATQQLIDEATWAVTSKKCLMFAILCINVV